MFKVYRGLGWGQVGVSLGAVLSPTQRVSAPLFYVSWGSFQLGEGPKSPHLSRGQGVESPAAWGPGDKSAITSSGDPPEREVPLVCGLCSLVSITYGQPWPQTTKCKITEINNPYVLNCGLCQWGQGTLQVFGLIPPGTQLSVQLSTREMPRPLDTGYPPGLPGRCHSACAQVAGIYSGMAPRPKGSGAGDSDMPGRSQEVPPFSERG